MNAIALPGSLAHAFRAAAGELGHADAAGIFAAAIDAEHGSDGVAAFRDALGREFPVADAVAGRWLSGWRPQPPDPAPVAALLRGIRRLAVVGLEAEHLDALLDALDGVRVGLLTWNALPADWERVIANGGGRAEAVDLDSIFGWAGPDAAILCFAYGDGQQSLFVPPAWLRLNGPDVRTQFRALIAWNVLPAPFGVYPRWFHEVPRADFTGVVSA